MKTTILKIAILASFVAGCNQCIMCMEYDANMHENMPSIEEFQEIDETVPFEPIEPEEGITYEELENGEQYGDNPPLFHILPALREEESTQEQEPQFHLIPESGHEMMRTEEMQLLGRSCCGNREETCPVSGSCSRGTCPQSGS